MGPYLLALVFILPLADGGHEVVFAAEGYHQDIERVELHYDGSPTGLTLAKDDGGNRWILRVKVPEEVPIEDLWWVQLRARSSDGVWGPFWPMGRSD